MKFLLITLCVLSPYLGISQTDRFDIASFTVPTGWTRSDSNGVMLLQKSSTINNRTSFCQIFLYPSQSTTITPAKNFEKAWNVLIKQPTGEKQPKTTTQKSTDGWTLVSGSSELTGFGMKYTATLVSLNGYGKSMTLLMNSTGNEFQPDIQQFLGTMTLNAGNASTSTHNTPAMNTGNLRSYDDYTYSMPENWVTNKTADYLHIIQQHSGMQRCYITLFPPQPTTGNLEQEAIKYFSDLYAGWNILRAGTDVLMKGYNGKGVEYCMIEAPMIRPRGDGVTFDNEDGATALFKFNNQVGLVTLRHENTGLYCECKKNPETWLRFFNSFSAKNFTPPSTPIDPAKAIIGSWIVMQGRALNNFIFAANNRFEAISGVGTMTELDNRTIELKSTAFGGNGSYTLTGNQLILRHDNRKNDPEKYFIRFEKVNEGSKGWKDRIYLLNPRPADGGKGYETPYERSIN